MLDFVDALLASDPHAENATDLFGPFVGSWSLLVTWYDEEGAELRRSDGEWHFMRVLEGRAMQDVWIVPSRTTRTADSEYEYGTSLRFAQADGTWRSTWMGPRHGTVQTFVARAIDAVISLESATGVTPCLRWEFFNVTPHSFEWRNVLVGTVDRVTQHFFAQRR